MSLWSSLNPKAETRERMREEHTAYEIALTFEYGETRLVGIGQYASVGVRVIAGR